MGEDTTQLLPNDGFQRILSRLDSIDARLDNIDSRLTTLEEKVDLRLQETRPIWEQVLVRLDGIETRLGKIEMRLEKVESEVYGLNKRFRIFNEDILKMQNKQEDLEERVSDLEPTQ